MIKLFNNRVFWICLLLSGAISTTGCVDQSGLHNSLEVQFNPHAFNIKPIHGVIYQDIPSNWWDMLHSSNLNDVIKQGIQHNPNLAAMKHSLYAAQAIVVKNNLSLNATFNASRQRIMPFIGDNYQNTTLFQPTLHISYDLDLFSISKNLVKSLQVQAEYQRFIFIAAYINLTANIAKTSVKIALINDTIDFTQKILAIQQHKLKIMENQYKLGSIPLTTVLTQRNVVITTQTKVNQLYQVLSEHSNLLAVLTGGSLNKDQLVQFSLRNFYMPRKLPLSLSSSIAQQRPDIRAAESLAKVASANVGIATANLLPQLSLSANYGWSKANLADLFSPANVIWNISSQLLQPIFNSGALVAQRKAAVAKFQQAAANYRNTVLQAFAEIANILNAIDHHAIVFNDCLTANELATKDFQIITKQLEYGSVSKLQAVDSELSLYFTKLQLLQAQADKLNDGISLMQALGGGWWNNKDYNG